MKKPRTAASESAAPPRMRLKLKTIDDVRAEMARLYREGKAGTRDVSYQLATSSSRRGTNSRTERVAVS